MILAAGILVCGAAQEPIGSEISGSVVPLCLWMLVLALRP